MERDINSKMFNVHQVIQDNHSNPNSNQAGFWFNMSSTYITKGNRTLTYDSVLPNPKSFFPETEDTTFFDTYFSMPRFVTESVLAVISILSNVLALVALRHVYGRQTTYHRLFVNLAVANILASILAWICNNTIYLFEEHLVVLLFSGTSMCEIFVFLLAAVFASSSFGIVSTFTMLGFTTVQYYAICRPLHHLSIIRTKRICIFLACTWILSVAIACIPFFVVLYIAKHDSCDEAMLGKILQVVVSGSNISIGVVAVAYVAIVFMCLRIYVEIRDLQKRLSQFRFEQDVNNERKAFVTIVILLSTLSVFFIPYACVYVVTLNSSAELDMHSDALIYYMNILPYIKFFSDPLIYGMRMREVRDAWKRMLSSCGIKTFAREVPSILVMPPSTATLTVPGSTSV